MYLLLVIASILPFCLGGCLTPEVVHNFNATAYLGTWYEQVTNPTIFEKGGRCVTAEYSLRDDGIIKVFNKMLVGDRTSSIEGTATLASKNGDAILDVEFDIIGVPVHAPYNVISTDYTSYAVVYSCSEILGIAYSSTSWILTREQNPPESLIKKGYSILEGQKIKTDSLKKTNQENCN